MSRQNEDDKDEGGVFIYIAMVIVVVATISVGRTHSDGFTTEQDEEVAYALNTNR